MFSKAMLDQLRAQRRQLRTESHLTPGGLLVQAVHHGADADREHAIARHETALADALSALRQGRAGAVNDGLAKAHFNHTTQEYSP